MQVIVLLLCLVFLNSCASYVSDNKYIAHEIKRTQSIKVKFDLLLDENITVNDPRVKSIIYASNKKSHLVIVYSNQNALVLADRLATIFTKQNLNVMTPYLASGSTENNLYKYVIVYIKY